MFRTDAERFLFLLESEAELAEFFEQGELSAEARDEERPKYITNYIGSKQKLTDWIWKATPEDAASAADAFSGSSVVGYMYKTHGLAVHSCDRLAYCHHIARAIVENESTTLTDEEIDGLVAANPKARDFVRKHFGGVYFQPGVHGVIDTIRSNIDSTGISGFKRDIALFALGKACITGKGGFGHFGTTKQQDGRADSPERFKERFADNCRRISALVFKGEKPCKAYHGDTRKVLAGIKTDVAYFDPPYATEFSQTNYERAYHFIEGLMTWWEGKEIQADSKTRQYEIPTEVTRANAGQFFSDFLGAAKHIPHWIISYRDHAFPTEPEIKKIIAGAGKSSRMQSKEHKYSISAKHSENSVAKEHLFVCSPAEGKTAGDVEEDGLQAAADHALGADGDLDAEEFFLSLTATHDPDLLEALAAQQDKDAVRVTAFMGNKYFILDFLWKQTPKDAKSVLDAFSGGANVGYFYKRKGLRVVSNDKLAYPHAIARALIENGSETLTEEEIDALFADNPKAGDFCERQFHGYYFTKPILHFLDVAWANIQALKGYKKDLALAALGWTVVGKAKFGQFSRSKKALTGPVSNPEGRQTSLTNIPLSDFQHRLRLNLARINKLVFDNGQENKATRVEAVEAVRKTDCDLVYADPPYITHFGTNDYEMNLHFVEGLMTMWEGKALRDNPRKDFESSTRYNRESIEKLIADVVRGSAGKHLLMSYRDKAYPDEKTIRGYFQERFKKTRVTGIDVQYAMIRNDPESGGKYARELVFVGSEPMAAKASTETLAAVAGPAAFHMRFTAELDTEALAAEASKPGDKRFKFILTHVGTNRNGDHFTADELRQAAKSAVGKKIDLSHSQEFRDIVGGIVEARFVEDGENSRVECVGELFAEDSEPARLAYKLMKRGIVHHVSMECDYQEGECSVCGKKVKSKADYCAHLKNFKGKAYQGKPVFEVLHGVSFTGMGLLDREGADEKAEIRQVAAHASNQSGGSSMGDEKNKGTKAADEPVDPTELSDADKVKLIKKQQADLERLTKENETLQQKLDDATAAQRRMVRKAKAEKLLAAWQEAGRDFGDDAGKTAELDRLMKLTDEGFDATEAAVQAFAAGKKKKDEEDPEEDPDDADQDEEDGKKPPFPVKKPKKPKKQASLSSQAGTPTRVTDGGGSLEEKLSAGFLAAYKDRIGESE
jgi:adenine-specific DNA-methyltransferase